MLIDGLPDGFVSVIPPRIPPVSVIHSQFGKIGHDIQHRQLSIQNTHKVIQDIKISIFDFYFWGRGLVKKIYPSIHIL